MEIVIYDVDVMINNEEQEVDILFEYDPPREAPPCRNPDNSAFYDCGDSAEIEFIGVMSGEIIDEHLTNMVKECNDITCIEENCADELYKEYCYIKYNDHEY